LINSELYVYLEDKEDNKIIDLKQVADYSYSVESVGLNTTRFELHFIKNNEPQLNGSVPNQEVNENADYIYQLESGLFTDLDYNDSINLIAELANGNPLPNWLNFDNSTGTFSGKAESPGEIEIKIKATDKGGKNASTTFVLSVKSTTGLTDLDMLNIKVYPNPTKDRVFVETTSEKENLSVFIRDNSGRLIKQQKSLNTVNEINLTDMVDGVYFIELSDGVKRKVYRIILEK